MKKYYSLLLAVIMLLSMVASPFSAFADDNVENALGQSISFDNEYFSSSDTDSIKASKVYTYKGTKYYSEGRELYTQIRDKIDRQEKSFVVHYFSTTQIHPNTIFGVSSWRNNTINLVVNIFMGATDYRLSVSCTDGDYSRWNVDNFMVSDFTVKNNKSKKYCYSFKLSLNYRYDKNQETALTGVISSIVNTVRAQNYSDYQALSYIHDYICDSTTYNYNAVRFPDSYSSSFSAYGALVEGRCVCQGYALAFYRICKELGYDVRFVASDPEIGQHAWNLIGVDGKYYFVDLTWDDGYKDGAKEGNPYSYFLVDYDTLRADDKGSYAHTLYTSLFGDSYFRYNYLDKLSQTTYDSSAYNLLSKSKISLPAVDYEYTGSGICPQVYVTDEFGNALVENVDYTLSYCDNTKCGLGIVHINGIGTYAGMHSQRSFNIKPAKAKTAAVKKSTVSDTGLTLSFDNVGATGYTVQMYKDGKWKTLDKSYSTTYKLKNLSPAKTYKLRVRAFESINRNTYNGAYSSAFTVCTAPKKVDLLSISPNGKAFTLKWKKVTADGYQIQYSNAKSMKKAKSLKVKSKKAVSKTVKGLKGGKAYYVRVRAYKTMKNGAGKTVYYYGKWSSKKVVHL